MRKFNFQASLPITFIREGDQYVAYTPALDLSTSGSTFEQAKRRFGEIVQIFFQECFSNGTLDSVLSDLGWTKEKSSWNPPLVVAQNTEIFNIPIPA